MNSSRMITVVNPPSATPVSFCTSAVMEKTIEMISVMIPSTVTRCSGKEENEPMLVIAYLMSDFVDHLLTPSVRSCTS